MDDSRAHVPRFSIIMNVYNGEQYLAEAIESVLNQVFDDWELIVWDDHSSDAGADVYKSYKDERIRYFLSPVRTNIGPARNFAIEKARGEWIAFLDQDDIWSSKKLELQNRVIELDQSGKLGIVYGRTIRFTVDGNSKNFDPWYELCRLPEGNIFEDLINKPSFISLSSGVISRKAIDEIGSIPSEIKYAPDYYLFVMASGHYNAACVQEVCCWYRVHENNMSRFYKLHVHREILYVLDRCADQLDRQLVRRRRKIHNTLVGIEQVVSGEEIWSGVLRIIQLGSLTYLLLKPLLFFLRQIRRALRPKKYEI